MSSTDAHYVHGHAESVLRSHRSRTVANSAAYLAPHLTPGVRVLDVGCGPGTITADIARHVGAQNVVAVDSSPDVVAQARAELDAAGAGATQVIAGDLYDLALPSESFDVVHAHQVLQHVPDPAGALRAMRRLCRPGGLVAARDADYAAFTWYPQDPRLDAWLALYRRLARAAGGEPDAGRRLLAWARAAGFEQVTPSATVWCYADSGGRSFWGGMWADRIVDSAIARQAVSSGEATQADLAELRAAWQEWTASSDGWFAILHGEVLCTA